MDTLAERLAHVRTLADVSQREMGRLAGLSESHVGLLERGARGEPDLTTIARLARAYDVSFEWLALGHGDAPIADRVQAARDKARAERSSKTVGGDDDAEASAAAPQRSLAEPVDRVLALRQRRSAFDP